MVALNKFQSRRGRALRPLVLLALGGLMAFGMAACGDDEASSPSTQSKSSTSSSPPAVSEPYEVTQGGKVLEVPGGKQIAVQPDAITGYVDNVIPEDGVINLTGWAAMADLSAPVEQLVGVVDEMGVAQTKPAVKRPDVVEAYGAPGIEESGFTLFIEASSLDCSAPAGGLTVFGIADGVAAPLGLVGNSMQELDASC